MNATLVPIPKPGTIAGTSRVPVVQVRPWDAGANWLPYVTWFQKVPTSHARWWPGQTASFDDREWSKRGYHLRGSVYDPSGLTREERMELCTLSNIASQALSDEQAVREAELRVRLPRLTVAGGYDIDASDPDVSAELARLIKNEETKRGVVLREAWSGSDDPTNVNPSSHKRHLEWGHAAQGHTHLYYAMLGRARDVCRAVGLVEVKRNHFALPGGEPKGDVDLSNLNRTPACRDAQFRVLGGAHKDGPHKRKALVPGSPEYGSLITPAMIEEGLALYAQQNPSAPKPGQKARTARPIVLPEYTGRSLDHTRTTAADWSGEVADRQALRLALAGTLLRSGLVPMQGIEQVLTVASSSITNESARTARHIAETTLRRLRTDQATVGAGKLRELVGTPGLLNLAWSLREDLKEFGLAYVWENITPHQINVAAAPGSAPSRDDVTPLLEALSKHAAETEDKAQKKRTHHVRRRLQGSTACGRRHALGYCPLCKGTRCKIHLYCNDPSCGPCAGRRVRDVADLIKFPASTRIVVRDGFATKAEAQKVYRGLPKSPSKKRPLALFTPTPAGHWDMTLFVDETDHGLVSAVGALEEAKVYKYAQPHKAVDWVVRSLLLKHAAARQAIETGGEVGVSMVLDAYGKHTASTRDASIHWPTKEEIRAARKARALEAARENGGAEAETECPCPEDVQAEFPTRYDVKNDDTGETIASGLASPPTLAQVSAFERGEPVRLHKPVKMRWRVSARAAGRNPARE